MKLNSVMARIFDDNFPVSVDAKDAVDDELDSVTRGHRHGAKEYARYGGRMAISVIGS